MILTIIFLLVVIAVLGFCVKALSWRLDITEEYVRFYKTWPTESALENYAARRQDTLEKMRDHLNETSVS